jgi:nitrate/TMAO reductase-like tetraheme cytochrome c subunit
MNYKKETLEQYLIKILKSSKFFLEVDKSLHKENYKGVKFYGPDGVILHVIKNKVLLKYHTGDDFIEKSPFETLSYFKDTINEYYEL